jgi:hypothetical protein
MRKVLLGFIVFFISISCTPLVPVQVTYKGTRIVGKSLVDSTTYMGEEFVFSERIYESNIDTTTGLLTTLLRGTSSNGKYWNNVGQIVQYDLAEKKILWSKKITYQYDNLIQFNNTMIFSSPTKSSFLDVKTGTELWDVKNDIYIINPKEYIGIGYKRKSSMIQSHDLEGIELKNGTILWRRNLSREFGWNDYFYLNDSTIVAVAGGLHAINVKNGKGWTYTAITGKRDYGGAVAANAIGATVGVLTGTYVVTPGANLIKDLVSNTLLDSTSIYMASSEEIAKIDKQTGRIDWKFSFQKDVVSKSFLMMGDSIIYMFNEGIAFMGYRQLDFGKPFFAAFNRKTGEQLFLTMTDSKEGPILNYRVKNEEAFLIFKNKIMKYSAITGEKLAEKDFTKEGFGEMRNLLGFNVFITKKVGEYVNLLQSDTTNIHVLTSLKKTLAIDTDLNITNIFDYEELNIFYERSKNYYFIAKDKSKTIVINKDGKQISEIEASLNTLLIGKTLYDKRDKSYYRIDLSELLVDEE